MSPTPAPSSWCSLASALLLGAALAAACGDGDSGPIVGQPVPQDDAPTQVPERSCAAFVDCNCDAFPDSTFDDADACEDAVRNALEGEIDEGEAAGLTYDGQCVGDVLAGISAIECRSLAEIAVDAQLVMRLGDIDCKLFYGEDVAGASCTELDDSNGDSCQRGLDCEDGVCRVDEELATGDPCEPGDACPYGDVCISLELGGDATCRDLPAIGATCLGEADLCDVDGFCDQASKTCAALPAAGAACASQGSVLGRRCAVGATCEDELCSPAPKAGEPCTTECERGSSCSAGVCQVERPLVCAFGLFD